MPTNAAIATSQSLRALIQHIVEKHHVYMKSELPFLETRLAKMCANHGSTRPELFTVQQLLQDFRDDITAHLEKEEQILFPYITSLETGGPVHACFPSVQFPIRVMLTEHDAATQIMDQIRTATAGYSVPPGFCENGAEFYRRLEGMEHDLKEHIRVENEQLFPRAIELESAQK